MSTYFDAGREQARAGLTWPLWREVPVGEINAIWQGFHQGCREIEAEKAIQRDLEAKKAMYEHAATVLAMQVLEHGSGEWRK